MCVRAVGVYAWDTGDDRDLATVICRSLISMTKDVGWLRAAQVPPEELPDSEIDNLISARVSGKDERDYQGQKLR